MFIAIGIGASVDVKTSENWRPPLRRVRREMSLESLLRLCWNSCHDSRASRVS